jgi:hypothetical protein
MTPMTQPRPLETWPLVPTRVVACNDDRLFPASFQRRIAWQRLGVETDLISGGQLIRGVSKDPRRGLLCTSLRGIAL